MPESIKHKELTLKIVKYTKGIVPRDNYCLIEVHSDVDTIRPLKTDEGFVPDVRYHYDGLFIIGEAKTSTDFFNFHSQEQYASYCKACSIVDDEAYFILAVPWNVFLSAKNLVRQYKQKYAYQFHSVIIDDYMKAEVI